MKKHKKLLARITITLIVLAILFLSGYANFKLKRRVVYAGCDSGCNTDINDTTDCVGFLSYLKENEPVFVSNAKRINVNLDKPDEYKKTILPDGHIQCWHYSNN